MPKKGNNKGKKRGEQYEVLGLHRKQTWEGVCVRVCVGGGGGYY